MLEGNEEKMLQRKKTNGRKIGQFTNTLLIFRTYLICPLTASNLLQQFINSK